MPLKMPQSCMRLICWKQLISGWMAKGGPGTGANGASYRIAPKVYEALGAEVIVTGNEPNGININDGCGSTHPEKLSVLVQKTGAHVGLAFDGDADRLIVVDEKGNVIDGDRSSPYVPACSKNKAGW